MHSYFTEIQDKYKEEMRKGMKKEAEKSPIERVEN